MTKNIFTEFFSFPNPVNEVSARIVAAGVFSISIVSVLLVYLNMFQNLNSNYPLIILSLLTYGFIARVTTGPKISPLALIVTKIIVPNLKLKEKPVAGPPKRFAQGIGLFVSGLSLILFILGPKEVTIIFLVILIIFSSLESFLNFCAGCKIFEMLIKFGLIPQKVCDACSNYNPGQTA